MAKTNQFKVELWRRGDKKVRVFVLREQGHIKTWSYVKGSKLTKARAEEIIKEYGTLRKTKKGIRIKRSSTKLTNFTENVETVKSSIKLRGKAPLIKKPTGEVIQYVVTGNYKGNIISGRSSRLGSPLAKTSREAKDQAWHNFLAVLGGKAINSVSDADEGIKHIDEVTNIREGWVSYVA